MVPGNNNDLGANVEALLLCPLEELLFQRLHLIQDVDDLHYAHCQKVWGRQ